MTDVKLQKGHPAIFRVPKSKAYLRISATFAAISVITIKVSVRGVVHAPNVLHGGAQLLNGSTRYLTRQRLPMAYVKLFLAVFSVPLLSSTSLSSSLLALGGMLAP